MFQSPKAEWLLHSPAIDEARWQNVTQLLCQLFKASAAAIVQYVENDSCVLTLRQVKNVGLVKGVIENVDSLKSRLKNPNLPSDGLWQYGLIELPLYWQGGGQFGAVILVCDTQPANLESCQMLAAPMLELIHCELIIYRHTKQIEQMSLQDETTQMLNRNGFNLMAPRQLNLSRRLGSHAGLVVMESGVQFDDRLAEDKIKALSLVVYDNMREADLAARLDNQIVLLAFVDSQANLDALIARLHKQFGRVLEDQRVLIGCCFFTPDSHLEFGPMLASARAELEHTRARLYPKPTDESHSSLKIDWLVEADDSLKQVPPSPTDKLTPDEPPEAIDTAEAHSQTAYPENTPADLNSLNGEAKAETKANLLDVSDGSNLNDHGETAQMSASNSQGNTTIKAHDTPPKDLPPLPESATPLTDSAPPLIKSAPKKKSRANVQKDATTASLAPEQPPKASTNRTTKAKSQLSNTVSEASKRTKAKAADAKAAQSDTAQSQTAKAAVAKEPSSKASSAKATSSKTTSIKARDDETQAKPARARRSKAQAPD